MKNTIIILAVVLLVGGLAYWFLGMDSDDMSAVEVEENENNLTFEESTTVMEPGTYQANTTDSVIVWEAGKPAILGYVHNGTFSLQSGDVTLTGEELTGEFVVDVDSLKVTSLGGGKAGQESALEGHLKADRFFDTATYPTATFTITDVSPKVLPGPDQAEYTATGELTMKGQTHEVTFPMTVIVNGNDEVSVMADIELDRTRWGIDFGSASIAESITENIIGDTVNLNLEVKLTK